MVPQEDWQPPEEGCRRALFRRSLLGIGPPLVVDESFIPAVGSQTLVPNTPNSNSTSRNFAGSFTVDAPAGLQSVTYALAINNPTTNLIDVATGQYVRLVPNGSGEVDGVITDQQAKISRCSR